MSCNACTRTYGFFCKESGCPNCGYSFCSKCLKKEIEVPRCNGTKMKVCLKCFEKLEKEKFSKKEVLQNTPNSAELFAMNDVSEEELATPIEPIYLAKEVVPDQDDEIENNLDSAISKKLSDLKNDGTKLPSDADMASRLATLKGVPYKEYSKTDLLLSTDNRTDKEKIDDLIKQFVEEKSIDEEASNPLADIERRLAALKGESSTIVETASTDKGGMNTPSDNEYTEEEATVQVMKKYMEEAKLPDVPTAEEEELIAGLPKPSKDTEELPWCTICNEDAVVRCFGCDGDLFCKSCYGECHDDEDFREHNSEPYSKPRCTSFKEDHF